MELINRGQAIQQESLKSTTRSQQLVEESKQIGTATTVKLKEQTEQIKEIDTQVMEVESNLKRADLLIRAFMRRMATDKFIMVFLFLIVVGILTIIIYKAVNPEGAKQQGFNVPDEITPPVNYQ